jgi:tetratricopeptide (TPR) repeat protein
MKCKPFESLFRSILPGLFRRRWPLLVFQVALAFIIASGNGHATKSADSLNSYAPFEEHLPQVPDLSERPQALVDAIRDAHERARGGAGQNAINGVRDLAMLFHANAYIEQAETCYRLLREAQSNEPRWAYLLADLTLRLGDVETTEKLIEATVTLQPSYYWLWLKLGAVRQRLGKADLALAAYQRCLELEATSPHALLKVARNHFRRERWEESQAVVSRLLEHNPAFLSGHLLAAELYEREGKTGKAEIARARASEFGHDSEPPDPWLDSVSRYAYDLDQIIELARTKAETGRMSEALRMLSRAEEIFGGSEAIHRTRGLAYAETGNNRKSIKAYTAALHAGGDAVPVYTELVRLYKKVNEFDLAIAMAQHGLKRDPEAVELHTELGALLYERGEREMAKTQWRKASDADPSYVPAIQNLAKALFEEEQNREAIGLFEKVREHSRLDFPSRAILGQYYVENDESDKAIQPLREALELQPGDPNLTDILTAALQNFGNRLAETGSHTEAVAAYKEALNLDPEVVELYGYIALVYSRMNNWSAASENYTQYLEHRPGDLAARLNYGDSLWQNDDFSDARNQWKLAQQFALKIEGTERFEDAVARRLEMLVPETEETQ